MATRVTIGFGALVVTQLAHSIEEYLGRLWESFPPAAFVSRLLSSNVELGFVVFNVLLVSFGFWCFLWPVRRNWVSAPVLIWLWIAIELINGVGHPAWSLTQGRYTPGMFTAPLLLILAVYLAIHVRRAPAPGSRAA